MPCARSDFVLPPYQNRKAATCLHHCAPVILPNAWERPIKGLARCAGEGDFTLGAASKILTDTAGATAKQLRSTTRWKSLRRWLEQQRLPDPAPPQLPALPIHDLFGDQNFLASTRTRTLQSPRQPQHSVPLQQTSRFDFVSHHSSSG